MDGAPDVAALLAAPAAGLEVVALDDGEPGLSIRRRHRWLLPAATGAVVATTWATGTAWLAELGTMAVSPLLVSGWLGTGAVILRADRVGDTSYASIERCDAVGLVNGEVRLVRTRGGRLAVVKVFVGSRAHARWIAAVIRGACAAGGLALVPTMRALPPR